MVSVTFTEFPIITNNFCKRNISVWSHFLHVQPCPQKETINLLLWILNINRKKSDSPRQSRRGRDSLLVWFVLNFLWVLSTPWAASFAQSMVEVFNNWHHIHFAWIYAIDFILHHTGNYCVWHLHLWYRLLSSNTSITFTCK